MAAAGRRHRGGPQFHVRLGQPVRGHAHRSGHAQLPDAGEPAGGHRGPVGAVDHRVRGVAPGPRPRAPGAHPCAARGGRLMARRPPSRHGRSISRFTPRRWLPFLVLTAVVAAGVAVASRDTGAPSATRAPASTTALVPAVAARGALSTAYFCGGGTARGPKGPAEMTIVIANDDRLGAQADITVYDDAGHHATRTVRVPADGRARVPAASIRTGAWVAATVEVRGGRAVVEREVRGPDAFDASPCSATASDVWYVPSGTTRRGSEEYLSVFNPFPDSSSVDISFATESGNRAPRSLQGVSVPGGSLRIVRVADTITNREVIAASVRARSGRVVVDRVQMHDGNGDPVKGTGKHPSTTPPPLGLV